MLQRSFPALGTKAVISTASIDALTIVWIRVSGWRPAGGTDLQG